MLEDDDNVILIFQLLGELFSLQTAYQCKRILDLLRKFTVLDGEVLLVWEVVIVRIEFSNSFFNDLNDEAGGFQ
jgi:hypothetical protein